MKTLFWILMTGVVLIGNAVYIARKIKKDPATKKYGKNPQTTILAMAIIGAACIVISGAGFTVANTLDMQNAKKTKVRETKTPETARKPEMTFEEDVKVLTFEAFSAEYAKTAALYKVKNLKWTFVKGEKADLQKQTGKEWSLSVMLSKSEPAYVKGLFYIFEFSEDQMEMLRSLTRMFALARAVDPSLNDDTVGTLCGELIHNLDKSKMSESGIEYGMKEVAGNMTFSIILPDK